MNKFSFVTQVGMIIVAVTIVIMYIQPKITTIRETQDLTEKYETETLNVSQVNEELRSKIAEIDAINTPDLQALARFMPDSVDDIAVLKDMASILESQSIIQYDIAYKGNTLNSANGGGEVVSEYPDAVQYYFTASFETNYAQLKSFLAAIETNDYTLQVSNLKITEATKGKLKIDLNLTTFSRASTTVAVTP